MSRKSDVFRQIAAHCHSAFEQHSKQANGLKTGGTIVSTQQIPFNIGNRCDSRLFPIVEAKRFIRHPGNAAQHPTKDVAVSLRNLFSLIAVQSAAISVNSRHQRKIVQTNFHCFNTNILD